MEATSKEAIRDLASEVNRMIADSGFERKDLLEYWESALISKVPERTWYVLKSDPSKVYSGRGRVPAWMVDLMTSEGLDPANAKDRKRFRDEFMDQEGAGAGA